MMIIYDMLCLYHFKGGDNMRVILKRLDGNKIATILFLKGWSLKKLIQKSNVAPQTIDRAINASKPVSPPTAKKIADALDVSVLDILQKDTEQEPA